MFVLYMAGKIVFAEALLIADCAHKGNNWLAALKRDMPLESVIGVDFGMTIIARICFG